MIWARLDRWFYLLMYGMWHGECAVDLRDVNGDITHLATANSDLRELRIWWKRPGVRP